MAENSCVLSVSYWWQDQVAPGTDMTRLVSSVASVSDAAVNCANRSLPRHDWLDSLQPVLDVRPYTQIRIAAQHFHKPPMLNT